MILTDNKVRSITKLYKTLLYSKRFVRPVVQLVVQPVVQQAAVCRPSSLEGPVCTIDVKNVFYVFILVAFFTFLTFF